MDCKQIREHLKGCANCRRVVTASAAAQLGRKGGSVSSPAKAAANRENGKKRWANQRAPEVGDSVKLISKT